MYVLDTDTLSRLHAGDPRLQQSRDQFEPADVVTTSITRIEILKGRFDFLLKAKDGEQLLRAAAWLTRSEELFRQIAVIPIDEGTSSQFDQLLRSKKLKKIGRADLLIAAVALAHGATLITRNVRHFRQIPGL